jgi:uncharacterized membrane protein
MTQRAGRALASKIETANVAPKIPPMTSVLSEQGDMAWLPLTRRTGRAMRATSLLAAMTLICVGSTAARTEIIKCIYTEPFVNTIFDSHVRTIALTRAEAKGAQSFGVSVRKAGGHIELTNRRRGFRQTMEKDGKGSDGMSDTVYPYSATLIKKGLPDRLRGGCRSAHD